MKPKYLKIARTAIAAFTSNREKLPPTRLAVHFHPKLELHYVIKGNGTRLTGDHAERFSAGDMVLFGQNQPRSWSCNRESNIERSLI